jgi:hypothetical protein
VKLVVDVLATARLARLVQRDTLTEPLRERIVAYSYRGPNGLRPRPGELTWQQHAMLDDDAPKLADLLDCTWCVAVWCAAFVTLARRTAPRLWDPIATMLASAYAAAVVDTLVEVNADTPR